MVKVVNLSDELSAEELAQLTESDTSGGFPVDNEWMILAEWLDIAGYQAYLDAKNDAVDENGNLKVTLPEILTLIEARRKIDAVRAYRQYEAAFLGTYSAGAKNPSQTFKRLTKDILNKTKVDF